MVFKNMKNIVYLLLLLLGIVCCKEKVVSASVGDVEISLNVEQIFEIQKGSSQSVDQKGSYELQEVNTGNPMPDGSEDSVFSFIMKGKKDSFTISLKYENPGIYKYQLRQITEEKENYDFDDTCYSITVYITEAEKGIIPQIIVQNENGEKCGKIRFYNIYKEKKRGNDQSEDAGHREYQNKKPVKTGDLTEIDTWIFCIAAAGFVIVVLLYRRKRN